MRSWPSIYSYYLYSKSTICILERRDLSGINEAFTFCLAVIASLQALLYISIVCFSSSFSRFISSSKSCFDCTGQRRILNSKGRKHHEISQTLLYQRKNPYIWRGLSAIFTVVRYGLLNHREVAARMEVQASLKMRLICKISGA